MSNFIYKLKAKLIETMNSIVRKENRIYLFSSFLYKDNIQAILDEIILQRINERYTVYCDGPAFSDYTGKNIVHVRHGSIASLRAFLRSSYVIYDIGIYGQIKGGKNQVLLNTWHGTSLKRIEYYLDKNKRPGMPPLCTYSISYSEFFKPVIMKAFGLDEKHVFITGEPRNDYLFDVHKCDILNKLNLDTSNKRIIIWMPTWRQNKENSTEVDGTLYELGIPFINIESLKRLNDICQINNTILIIKWHGLQNKSDINQEDYPSIVFLTSESIAKVGMPLYYLVGCCDALITDYSSVYVNYLVLNKPICFAYDDIEEYKNNRGFMFEDVEKIMPGIHVRNLEGIIDFISNYQDKDYYEERVRMNKTLNAFSDNHNSYRVLESLGLIE